MESKTKLIIAGVGGVLLLLGVALGIFWWFSDGGVGRALTLRDQLLETEGLAGSTKNKLTLHLMRTVDEMDRDAQRDLQERLREEQRTQFQQNLARYSEATDDLERNGILDQTLDQMAKSREVNGALFGGGGMRGGGGRGGFGGGPRGPRPEGGTRPDRGSQAQGGNDRGQGNAPAGGPARGGDRGARADRPDRGNRGDRQDAGQTEEERAASAAFYEALRKRAEERGIEMGRGGGRGRA